jgi:radical SAM-linked protein
LTHMCERAILPSMDTQQRWRVTFSKGAPVKYISHLDLCQAWERALRRADLPLAYSQGFNPQARLHVAAALPVGYTGSAELMDVILTRPVAADKFLGQLRPVVPCGLAVLGAHTVELKAPSLQSSLSQAEYRVSVCPAVPQPEVEHRIGQFLSLEHFEQRRIRKQQVETIDLRPLVDSVRVDSRAPGAITLWMRVSAGAGGNVRPETVLEALGFQDTHPQIERTRLICAARE